MNDTATSLEESPTINALPSPDITSQVPLDVNPIVSSLPRQLQNLNAKLTNDSLEQFSSVLFEDLENLLEPTISENPAKGVTVLSLGDKNQLYLDKDFVEFSSLFAGGELSETSSIPKVNSFYTLSYDEENMMLKHFFKKLLPLLDAHPNSPWPDLALRYCDFDVARSCFISLACIHLYESQKSDDGYYSKGMAHINVTMEYLIRYIGNNDEKSITDSIDYKKKQVSYVAILVLINVHILFVVLEKGKSSFVRFFFKVFASICQDPNFYKVLMESAKKKSLLVVLSWYDTVSAIVSPDCRLPYCSPNWYGSSSDSISTSTMMGCPGEIFKAMSKVCFIRSDIHNGIVHDRTLLLKDYGIIKSALLNYREYVPFESVDDIGYNLRLACAQCWALAILITLEKLVKPELFENRMKKYLHEFINVYGSMESKSPMVTQMVWPVYAVGCECETVDERKILLHYMDTLYDNAQMGTLYSLRDIVQKVWEHNITQEQYLETWLESGVDYLPL